MLTSAAVDEALQREQKAPEEQQHGGGKLSTFKFEFGEIFPMF